MTTSNGKSLTRREAAMAQRVLTAMDELIDEGPPIDRRRDPVAEEAAVSAAVRLLRQRYSPDPQT